MKLILDAACGCNIGCTRSNNEDNFLFADQYLPSDNRGLETVISFEKPVKEGIFLAVFDGVGGEPMGEVASYTAARTLNERSGIRKPMFKKTHKYLEETCFALNKAVFDQSSRLLVNRMSATVVSVYFEKKRLWVTNVGDSRAFRLRGATLEQISVDHTDEANLLRRGIINRRPRLIQALGSNPDEVRLAPHIWFCEMKTGDMFLLCSDGLTDELTNEEISEIMRSESCASDCVRRLIDEALARGGKDNVTAIVCKLRHG